MVDLMEFLPLKQTVSIAILHNISLVIAEIQEYVFMDLLVHVHEILAMLIVHKLTANSSLVEVCLVTCTHPSYTGRLAVSTHITGITTLF